MKEFTYVIKEELGLHARPAGLLVKEAKKFQSATTLAAKGKTAAAGKLIAIMSMGVKQGAFRQSGWRAGARLELLARNAHDERAEHEADDLRADILHLCRAVQAHRAGNIAQETRDAEAHVRRVTERR